MPSSGDGRARTIRVALVVLGLAIAISVAWKLGLFQLEDRTALAAAIERARSVRFVAVQFVATYAVAAAIGVPATPLTLAGGALFGAPLGIALNWLGEMLAAMLAFAITRATGLGVAKAHRENGTPLIPTTRSGAFATLFRLRLVPVAPFALLNAGAAISGMSWRDFIAATALGIVPITAIYTVSASQLVAGVEGSGGHALTTAVISAVVLIAISFVPSLLRSRRASRPRDNAE